MLINMHGWHGNIKDGHTDNVDPCTCGRFTMIAPEMRGRGDSSGRPDANGWELYDGVDVLDACRRSMPAAVSSSAAPRLWGGSGGADLPAKYTPGGAGAGADKENVAPEAPKTP